MGCPHCPPSCPSQQLPGTPERCQEEGLDQKTGERWILKLLEDFYQYSPMILYSQFLLNSFPIFPNFPNLPNIFPICRCFWSARRMGPTYFRPGPETPATMDSWNAALISYTNSTAQGGGGSFKNGKPIGEVGSCESRMAERIHW